MSAPTITVTDYNLANQVGEGILLGKSFAFLPGDLLDRPALRWIKSLVPAAAAKPRVLCLLGPGPVELPGMKLLPVERPALSTAVVTSDKALYREGADVANLFVCDPFGRDRDVELEIELSGMAFGKRPLKLSGRGAGSVALRDLPCGDYKVRVRGTPAGDPACTFTVAEYRLSPLVAALENQRLDGDRITLTVGLTAFGVPASGGVTVELLDAGRRIERTDASARDGRLEVALTLRGDGPHTVNFQLAADPGRTATIPLVGSRAAERRDTVFSALGAEVLGALIPADEAKEVRGIFLRRGGTSTSPVRLDRVDARKPKLSAMTDLDTLTIAIIDPTLARRPEASDPNSVEHPASYDENYRYGEQMFLDGNIAAALESFEGARARTTRQHANYAYYIACCHARLGNRPAALAWLRVAFHEGWSDLGHMRGDNDLAAVRDEPEFELLCNGGIRIIEAPLKRGESITLDVAAPLAYLAIGAFVDGQPWEGHAAIVVPPTTAVQLEVPAKVTPGTDVTIEVKTAAAPTSVYVIVKDARLLSADTPTSRLAGQLKSHVDAMRDRDVLGTGTTKRALTSLIPPPPMNLPYGGPPSMPAYGMGPTVLGAASFAPTGMPQMRGGMGGMAPVPSAPGSMAPPRAAGAMPPPVAARPSPPAAYSPAPMAMAMPNMAQGAPPDLAYMKTMTAGAGVERESDGMESEGAHASPEGAASTKRTADEAPEVVFAGLVAVRDGAASVTVTLGGAFADYVVEAFAIDGVEWAAATARFRAERAVFAEFDAPAFVHRDDTALGRVVVGGGTAGITVEVTRDGKPIAITADGEPVRGPIMQARSEIAFVAEPGDYVARVVDTASGEIVESRSRVDEPGKLRRVARSMQFLRPGERVSRRDDPSIVSLRVLPGLDKPFSLLCDATADYGHACCEQTAAKLLAACSMYMFAGDNQRRRERAEEIVIAGVRRERTMFMPGRGFRMYPDSGNTPNDYYGPMTAKYLWNLDLLRSTQSSRALVQAIDDGLEMARDSTRAYRLQWPPINAQVPADAYAALRFGQDARVKEAALGTLRSWVEDGGRASTQRGHVGFRADAAYVAAGLFRAGGDANFPAALHVANRVVGELGTEGRLYSTVDSVAAIAMMTEIQAAGVVGTGARAVVDGRTVEIATVTQRDDAMEIAASDATVAVEVTRIVEEDWDQFTARLAVTVTMLGKGRPTARVMVGDPVDLQIRIDAGYQAGDLVWVALPDALSRVIGGGQVKRFSVDLAGKPEITIPLAATAITVDRTGEEAPQHFSVCVRNMFEEERAGNPGPLDVTVAAPRGGDGLLARAASALRRLLT